MNDEELDGLFREAAERYSAAGQGAEGASRQQAAWEQLARRLDEPEQAPVSRRSRWPYLLLGLLLLGLGTWLLWPGRKTTLPETESVTTTPRGKPAATPPAGQEGHAPPAARTATSPAARAAATPGVAPAATAAAEPAEPSAAHGATLPRAASRQGGLPPTARQADEDLTLYPPLHVLDKRPVYIAGMALEDQLGAAALAGAPRLPGLPGRQAVPSLADTLDGEETAYEEENTHKKALPSPAAHWYFGLHAGPDWSGVAARRWEPGIGGGLDLVYRLNGRWAIQTGLSAVKKIYRAMPGDYHPADNGWRQYDVKHIDANCSVWDLPLNLQYTLQGTEHHRLFVSTGLSSFWMHEEKYTYYYKTPAGAPGEWTKAMRDQNRHLFSIINLSAGYERSWRHLSLQFAPYAKIPMGGVGYGKVKLYSAGIELRVLYGLK